MEIQAKLKSLTPKQCDSMLRSVDDALYIIGGKWKLKIIIALTTCKRFNEIQRQIKGVSARLLSKELKELEMNGFVKRIIFADANPVRVEYELTEYSDILEPVVIALKNFGRMHKEKIVQKS